MALKSLHVDNTPSIGTRRVMLEFSSADDIKVFVEAMKRADVPEAAGYRGEMSYGGQSKYTYTTPSELDGEQIRVSTFAAPDRYFSPDGVHEPGAGQKQHVTHQAYIEIEFPKNHEITERNLFEVEQLLRKHHVQTGISKAELLTHMDASNELSQHNRGSLVKIPTPGADIDAGQVEAGTRREHAVH